MAAFQRLPNEIIHQVCEFCTKTELQRVRLVCKNFAAIARALLFKKGIGYFLDPPNIEPTALLDERLPPIDTESFQLRFTRAGASWMGWDGEDAGSWKALDHLRKVLSKRRKIELLCVDPPNPPTQAFYIWLSTETLSLARDLESLNIKDAPYKDAAHPYNSVLFNPPPTFFPNLKRFSTSSPTRDCSWMHVLNFVKLHKGTLAHLDLYFKNRWQISQMHIIDWMAEAVNKPSALETFQLSILISPKVEHCLTDKLRWSLPEDGKFAEPIWCEDYESGRLTRTLKVSWERALPA